MWEEEKIASFREKLLAWYDAHKRDLPWRRTQDPYKIWISEIMLQQTRIEAAKAYYDRFTKCLPDIPSLAAVSEEELLKLWEGLGYYNRARNLKKAASLLVERCRPIMICCFHCRESADIQRGRLHPLLTA